MEVYYLNTLSDYDVENETEVYYQTVKQVKNIINNHKEETRIMIKDNAWKDVTLLLLNNPITDDEDWEGELALTTKEDHETDGFIGAVGDKEMMYKWICTWLNGDYDFDDWELI